MRSSLAIPAVLVLSLSVLGCPAPEEIGPSLGTETDTVTIHLMPAQANSPFTVKLTPPLPSFDSAQYPNGLTFIRHPAPGPSPRWDRVAVGDFVDAGTENPVGTLEGSCNDLGTERNAVDRCRVVFENTEDTKLFKYSVKLFEAATEPTEAESRSQPPEERTETGDEEPAETVEEPAGAMQEQPESSEEVPDLVIDPIGIRV